MTMEDVNLGNLITGVWIILITIGGPQINFTVVLRDGKMSLKSTIYKILHLSNEPHRRPQGQDRETSGKQSDGCAMSKMMKR
jgi:hypothetical protein